MRTCVQPFFHVSLLSIFDFQVLISTSIWYQLNNINIWVRFLNQPMNNTNVISFQMTYLVDLLSSPPPNWNSTCWWSSLFIRRQINCHKLQYQANAYLTSINPYKRSLPLTLVEHAYLGTSIFLYTQVAWPARWLKEVTILYFKILWNRYIIILW